MAQRGGKAGEHRGFSAADYSGRGIFYKDYASLFRNNKELVKSLSPSNSIVAVNSWYAHNRMDNLPLVKIGEDAVQKPEMRSGPRKNLTIVY